MRTYAELLQTRVAEYEYLILSEPANVREQITASKDIVANTSPDRNVSENNEELEKQIKDLDQLKIRAVEGIIQQALEQKDRYSLPPHSPLPSWILHNYREIEQLKSKLLLVEEDANWDKARLEISEKNNAIMRGQLQEHDAFVKKLIEERAGVPEPAGKKQKGLSERIGIRF